MTIHEFCVSYNTPHFDATVDFYTNILGFTPGVKWNRVDGKGAFLVAGGNGTVELFGAPDGEVPYDAPPPGSFMIVLMVDDVDGYQSRVIQNGAQVKWPMEEYEWGRYFGVEDPNQVEIYFMQRLGENIMIAAQAILESQRKQNMETYK